MWIREFSAQVLLQKGRDQKLEDQLTSSSMQSIIEKYNEVQSKLINESNIIMNFQMFYFECMVLALNLCV